MTRLFTDMIGHTIRLDHPPSRIVSLVPSQTELLYDLGLSDEVVGITKFCVHPEDWFQTKKRVGGTKTADVEAIQSLRPDLIIANKEENTQQQVLHLAASYPVWTSDVKRLEDALVMIRNVAVMTGTMNIAMSMEREIKAGFARIQPTAEPKRALYLIWKNPYMAAGGDTYIHDMMGKLGFQNVLATTMRYPELTREDIVDLKPDLVLLSSEPYPFKEKHIEELGALLPTATAMLVDGEMFSWYGSRIVPATAYFQQLVHTINLSVR
jgi:ABC-type Fe3+-hydroxamate transport system substrate-binding protein